MSSDALIRYEEDNHDELVDKFLEKKVVRDLWEEFVYEQYMDNMPEPPDDDRIKEDVFPPDETETKQRY